MENIWSSILEVKLNHLSIFIIEENYKIIGM